MLSQEPTKSVLATANCNLTRPEHQRKQPIEQGAFRWHELRGLKPSGCSRPDTMQGPTCLGIGSSSRALHSPVHRQQSRLRPAKVLQTPRPGGVSDGDSTADQRKLLNELLKRSGTPHEVVAKTSIPQPVAVSTAPAGSKAAPPSLPSTDEDVVWAFSYGANMCFDTLSRRDVRVLSRDAAFVKDPTIRLVFKHRGGYATLEARASPQPARGTDTTVSSSSSNGASSSLNGRHHSNGSNGSPAGNGSNGNGAAHAAVSGNGSSGGADTQGLGPNGIAVLAPEHSRSRVHGVLYRLKKSELRKLHSREHGYVLQEMEVVTYDGRTVSAHVFVSSPLARLPQEVAPPEKYMMTLREGAAFNFLDPVWQAWLSSVRTVPSVGLPQEYWNTPSRYIAYSFILVALSLVAGYLLKG